MNLFRCCTFVLTILFSLTSTTWAEKVTHTSDSLATVKKSVDEKKAVIVDCRSQKEWDAGHLQGAILLPLLELEAGLTPEELKKRLPDDKILYIHCVVGARALAVQEMLKPLKYDARALKPGYRELVRAGFPPAQK